MPKTTPKSDTVVITHPDKLLFPDDGITKGQLADYYEAMAPLRHAVTLDGGMLDAELCDRFSDDAFAFLRVDREPVRLANAANKGV